MQRLFSTFADGWPGRGLLLQRLLIAVVLLRCGIRYLGEPLDSVHVILHLLGAVCGIFILVGLWTPVFGTLAAIIDALIVLFHASDPWMYIALAMLAATLAMIGPGAWSIDARLFGRKHFED